MKKIYSILVAVVVIQFTYAQDIMISVKKGKATINGKEWLTNYPPKKIGKTDLISATENSILLIRKGSSIAKINCPCSKLNFAGLAKKIAANGKNLSYTSVIFNKPLEARVKTQTGGVSRGSGALDTFSINLIDSAWIMNDEYKVQWRSDLPSEQLGNLRLVKLNENFVSKESTENNITLLNLTSGWYHLDFALKQSSVKENWTLEATYLFYIPTEKEKEQVLNEIKGITEELNQFEDEELSDIILEAHKKDRRLYGLSEN